MNKTKAVKYIVKIGNEFYFAADRLLEARKKAKSLFDHKLVENLDESVTIEKKTVTVETMNVYIQDPETINEVF